LTTPNSDLYFEQNGKDDFAPLVRLNQQKLTSDLKSRYDFIVCGSRSSGSVIARRLAENPAVSLLLLEAGGNRTRLNRSALAKTEFAGKFPRSC
jgi:choline dehydrogenase